MSRPNRPTPPPPGPPVDPTIGASAVVDNMADAATKDSARTVRLPAQKTITTLPELIERLRQVEEAMVKADVAKWKRP